MIRESDKKSTMNFKIPAFIVLVVALGLLGYGQWLSQEEITELSIRLNATENKLNETRENLESNIAKTQAELVESLQHERENINRISRQIAQFEDEVGDISGSVGTLEKLTRTDPQLLQKYSRVFFLNEHYQPPRLEEIPTEYVQDENRRHRILAEVLPFLESMVREARNDGIDLLVASAFRSFEEQANIKHNYTITYGAGTANQFSADQGYSEHQLGTAIDFTTQELSGQLRGFENDPAYDWLRENAHRFGFTISYPEENEHYIFEPWHWRFVGVKLATDLHEAGDYFYDWDQRKIDEYLIHIFDNS